MRDMKDCGIEWLGNIPDDWEKGRIDSYYNLRSTKVSDKEYQPLSVTMNGILPQLETAAKTNAHDDRKLVKKGDFAINSRSDRRGSCGISNYTGSVSLINTILAPKGEMHPKYFDWLFHTVQFSDEFYKWGHGIVDDLWTTTYQDMKKINIPVPPLEEQKYIADFLDYKCEEIDKLYSVVQYEIETLESYKQSVIAAAVKKGDETRFKYIAKVCTNLVNPELYQDYKQIAPDSIEKNTGKIIIDRTVEEAGVDSWNHLFYKGQILYSKIRPVLNKVAISPYDGLCSADMYPIETSQDIRFLKYVMLSNSFVEQVDLVTRDRIKMPKINQDELGNIRVLMPSLEEQSSIADYLDSMTGEVDGIISKKQEQLAVLTDYKKSIIYEYVTGKKEVPEI